MNIDAFSLTYYLLLFNRGVASIVLFAINIKQTLHNKCFISKQHCGFVLTNMMGNYLGIKGIRITKGTFSIEIIINITNIMGVSA